MPAADFIDLTDEPADGFRICFRVGDLVGILGDDVIDRRLDGAEIGDLFHAALRDDGARIAALRPDDFEQILGRLAGNRAIADEIEDGAELAG